MENQAITLYELNHSIQEAVKNSFRNACWIIAEIADIKENSSGHCYLELVEKGDDDNIRARAKATIWSFTYRMLKPYFRSVAGIDLREGMKINFNASVEFHELYGFSLNVKDINPEFTLGDIAFRRKEIIKQLTDEGVFEMNKQLHLALVPQRIAIISSKSAAGFGDFVNQLDENINGYKIHWKLFPALMQGNEVESSIIAALEKINEKIENYDAVAIIRGGGAQSDLSFFDNYWLAYHVTQFPIPVFTGIGHQQDDSIVDMVAHTRLKTPTAVADFIINRFIEFENILTTQQQELVDLASNILLEESAVLDKISFGFPSLIKNILFKNQMVIERRASQFSQSTTRLFANYNQHLISLNRVLNMSLKNQRQILKLQLDEYTTSLKVNINKMFIQNINKLAFYEETSRLSDPQNVLSRGYSITFKNNKLITNINELSLGDVIENKLHSGVVKGVVTEVTNTSVE